MGTINHSNKNTLSPTSGKAGAPPLRRGIGLIEKTTRTALGATSRKNGSSSEPIVLECVAERLKLSPAVAIDAEQASADAFSLVQSPKCFSTNTKAYIQCSCKVASCAHKERGNIETEILETADQMWKLIQSTAKAHLDSLPLIARNSLAREQRLLYAVTAALLTKSLTPSMLIRLVGATISPPRASERRINLVLQYLDSLETATISKIGTGSMCVPGQGKKMAPGGVALLKELGSLYNGHQNVEINGLSTLRKNLQALGPLRTRALATLDRQRLRKPTASDKHTDKTKVNPPILTIVHELPSPHCSHIAEHIKDVTRPQRECGFIRAKMPGKKENDTPSQAATCSGALLIKQKTNTSNKSKPLTDRMENIADKKRNTEKESEKKSDGIVSTPNVKSRKNENSEQSKRLEQKSGAQPFQVGDVHKKATDRASKDEKQTKSSITDKQDKLPQMHNKPSTVAAASTAATLLRDTALLVQQEREMKKQLDAMVHSLVDPMEIENRSALAKQQIEEEERAAANLRRMRVQLIHEEAQIARETSLAKRAEAAADVKSEREAINAQLEEFGYEDILRKKEIIECVQEIEERAAIAKAKHIEANQLVAKTESEKTEAMLREHEQRMQEELEAKKELIQQIKALEEAFPVRAGAHTNSSVSIDPTVTSNCGLLTEMSMVELSARLEKAHYIDEQEREKKANAIQEAKEARRAELRRCEELLSQRKPKNISPKVHCTSADATSVSKKTTEARVDPRVLEIQQKIKEKREALKKLVKSNAGSPRHYKMKIKPKVKSIAEIYRDPISISEPELCVPGAVAAKEITANMRENAQRSFTSSPQLNAVAYPHLQINKANEETESFLDDASTSSSIALANQEKQQADAQQATESQSAADVDANKKKPSTRRLLEQVLVADKML